MLVHVAPLLGHVELKFGNLADFGSLYKNEEICPYNVQLGEPNAFLRHLAQAEKALRSAQFASK